MCWELRDFNRKYEKTERNEGFKKVIQCLFEGGRC